MKVRMFIGRRHVKGRTVVNTWAPTVFCHDIRDYALYVHESNRNCRMWAAPLTDPRKLRLPGSV